MHRGRAGEEHPKLQAGIDSSPTEWHMLSLHSTPPHSTSLYPTLPNYNPPHLTLTHPTPTSFHSTPLHFKCTPLYSTPPHLTQTHPTPTSFHSIPTPPSPHTHPHTYGNIIGLYHNMWFERYTAQYMDMYSTYIELGSCVVSSRYVDSCN